MRSMTRVRIGSYIQDFDLQVGHNLSVSFRMGSSSEDGDVPPRLLHQALSNSRQGPRKHVNRS